MLVFGAEIEFYLFDHFNKNYICLHLVIFRLVAPTEGSREWDIVEVKRLLDHQDNILSLANVNGKFIVYMFILWKILYLLM